MKLRDVSPSTPHRDSTRYIARVEMPLNPSGIKRLQTAVQAYTKDHSRVLIAPTRCVGVIHKRGPISTVLCDIKVGNISAGIQTSSQQEMKVSKIQVQPQDVIVFALLPGGSQLMRSFYRGQVKDWADDLIVEEVEWLSWIALVTNGG